MIFGTRQKTSRERYEGNPLYANEKTPFLRRRSVIAVFALCIVALIWAGVMIFAPTFQITSFTVPSLLFIPETKVRATTQELLNERYYGVIPRHSFWALNIKELSRALHERYPFASFLVQKTYPNTLSIGLTEPIYLFDWVTGDGSEYYVNRDSMIVYEVPKPIVLTVQSPAADVVTIGTKKLQAIPEQFIRDRTIAFPLIFDPAKRYQGIGASVASKRLLTMLEELNRGFARGTGVVVAYIDLGTRPDHIRVITEEGWAVLWNEDDDSEKQIRRLVSVLREKVRNDRNKLEYVDLRFGDKVYLKKRASK